MQNNLRFIFNIILILVSISFFYNCKSISIKSTRPDYLVYQDFVEKAKTADMYKAEGFIKIKGLSEASAIKLPVPLNIITLKFQLMTSLKQEKSMLVFFSRFARQGLGS